MTGTLPAVATTRRTSDLVWDGGLHGTVFVDNAAPLLAGADVGWTPDLLLASAVGAELMTLVLRQAAAAGVEILGYVSEQRLDEGSGRPTVIVLTPCVSVRSQAAADLLEPIIASAVETILRRNPIREVIVESRISIVPPCERRW